MDKQYDAHSVYGYDPDTGVARDAPDMTLYCPGCGDPIAVGAPVSMLTGVARHPQCARGQ